MGANLRKMGHGVLLQKKCTLEMLRFLTILCLEMLRILVILCLEMNEKYKDFILDLKNIL